MAGTETQIKNVTEKKIITVIAAFFIDMHQLEKKFNYIKIGFRRGNVNY